MREKVFYCHVPPVLGMPVEAGTLELLFTESVGTAALERVSAGFRKNRSFSLHPTSLSVYSYLMVLCAVAKCTYLSFQLVHDDPDKGLFFVSLLLTDRGGQ